MKNAGVDNVVEPLLKASDEAAQIWKEPIEFLYLDVNYHDYELSKNDLADWSKHVIDGGTIAITTHILIFARLFLKISRSSDGRGRGAYLKNLSLVQKILKI